jgi:site-specific DNA-methyltransferase (adenine-specific)
MEYMATIEDNYFDLAVVDPPYGINVARKGEVGGGDEKRKTTKFKKSNWDNNIPSPEYFKELVRVSRNQIIWGGNYFIEHLKNTSCMIIWDKKTSGDFADAELAWTSFKTAVRIFPFVWSGFRQGDMKNKEKRIHLTQKPVALYKWVLMNYAKPGDKILDTHLGSGSSAIAAAHLHFDFVGCELDTDYFNAAKERLYKATRQLSLF